jgi:hypothetical protein
VNQNFYRIINGMLGENGRAIWIVLMQEGTNSMGIIFNKIYTVFVLFYWISPRAFFNRPHILHWSTAFHLKFHKLFFPSLIHQIPIQKVVAHFRKFCLKSPSPKDQDDYQWGISTDIEHWRDWRRQWKVSSWWMVIRPRSIWNTKHKGKPPGSVTSYLNCWKY